MAISTKATLRAAASAFLNRADLDAHIDTFIELATARFSDELRCSEMEKVATKTLAAEWTLLPADFRAVRVFEAGGKVLEYRTPWQFQKLIEMESVLSVPMFTIQDMQFRVYPFPTSTVVELTYYSELEDLLLDADSNWLLLKRPDVYLKATLSEARLFLHDDQRLVTAQAFVDKYIMETNRASGRIAYGAAPLAVRAA